MAGTTNAVERKVTEKKPMTELVSDEADSRRPKMLKGETRSSETTKTARKLMGGGGYPYYDPMYDYEYVDPMQYPEPMLPYPPPPHEYLYYRSPMMKSKKKKSAGYGYGYPGYYKSKAMMSASGYGNYEAYYPMEGMYDGYAPPMMGDDMYGEGDDFLKQYGGACVHVIEVIHFEMPPNTDVFEPNGSVFGEVGTMHVWALTTVAGYGTLDGKCIRTWPDFDGLGGDAVCEFVLTDPETGDQLTFGGKLDSIMPGGRMAVTGGSGSVSGVFGDMIIHANLEGGKDVLDKAKFYEVEGTLGIIHCPVHNANR